MAGYVGLCIVKLGLCVEASGEKHAIFGGIFTALFLLAHFVAIFGLIKVLLIFFTLQWLPSPKLLSGGFQKKYVFFWSYIISFVSLSLFDEDVECGGMVSVGSVSGDASWELRLEGR